jgi:hypothetical protein
MHQWAPIETTDALQLLSPSFQNQQVRFLPPGRIEPRGNSFLLYNGGVWLVRCERTRWLCWVPRRTLSYCPTCCSWCR